MLCATNRLSAALLLMLACVRAEAAGDPAAGKAAFADQCSSCHTIDPNANGFGPSLSGVVGRHAGAVANFAYSAAMASSKLVWEPADIDAFLTSTTTKVPGTSMPVAIPDAALRANVIAYLATLKALPPLKPGASAAPTALKHGPTDEELGNAAKDKKNWLYASKDYSGQRYVELKQITPANAAQLRPVCLYRSATTGSTQTNPLVYDGVMYFTIDETTVAIDAATCRQKWTYTWEIKDRALSKTNRGVALKDGRVVRGTPDGYLIALNMADGTLIWSQKIADAQSSQYLSMPPLIYKDMVIYGPAGADWGAKNWIAAYKLDTGEQIWRFNEIPDANEPGANSWKDDQSREHGGGSLWTPLSLDTQAGIVYVPVGNPAPDFDKSYREGNDLYTDSALALDVKTGRLLWYHQFVPDDDHDRDLSQVSPLFDATIAGKKRKLISVAGKDGLLRVLDRETHDQLYEVEITSRTDWDKSPTVEGVHSCPGLLGGLEWNGPAYSRATNTLFVATVDWCGTFRKSDQPASFTAFSHFYNGAVTPDPRDQSRGWLQALDASTGKPRWKQQWPTPLVAGITATEGGVLFTGDLNDNFLAIDAASGKTLYSFNTGGSIGGGVISYELNGKQYVATTTGVVSGFFGGNGPSAIVIFALP